MREWQWQTRRAYFFFFFFFSGGVFNIRFSTSSGLRFFSFLGSAMSDIYDNFGFDKDHAATIGMFAIAASAIENTIETILLGLLNTDKRYGGAAIRWISKQKQIELIMSILKDKHGVESDEYIKMKQCLDDARTALDSRHEYVHSIYYLADGFRINPKRGKFAAAKLKINLTEMKEGVVQATGAMIALTSAAGDLDLPYPVPSQDTQTPQSPNQEDTQDQTEQEHPDPPQSSGE
ncbi:MAG: hypothetical protein IH909_05550 [Proteobacteria bacterium]|nr:hypothetical protein [Pseudomonadota bacterium]